MRSVHERREPRCIPEISPYLVLPQNVHLHRDSAYRLYMYLRYIGRADGLLLLPNQTGCSEFPLGYISIRTEHCLEISAVTVQQLCGEAREIERSHITRPLTRGGRRYEAGLMYDLCLCKAWKPQIVDTRTRAGRLSRKLSIDSNGDGRYLTRSWKSLPGKLLRTAARWVVDVCRLSPTIDTTGEGGKEEIGFISNGEWTGPRGGGGGEYQERIDVSTHNLRARVLETRDNKIYYLLFIHGE